MPFADSMIAPAVSPPVPALVRDRLDGIQQVGEGARRWVGLAVSSLVIAGLLSLSVVIGRLPLISNLIGDPLFFKRCLVVHVDLALVVWFYSFLAGLNALRDPESDGRVLRLAFGAAVAGVGAMLVGAVAPGAQPILSNYIPVIDHPLFLSGLIAFFAAVVVMAITALARSAGTRTGSSAWTLLPADASVGVLAASIAIVLAFATWVSTEAGLPSGLDRWTRFEFSAWGVGHVLQVANVSAMLAVWLWILARATGRQVLSVKAARLIFAALVVPHFVMPLLTMQGSLDRLYHSGATLLMRWGIFPIALLVLVLSIRHLVINREDGEIIERRAILAGFQASAGLALLGFVLGACIRGSTTLVPAHYHASLGAVTAAFMTAAYLVADRISQGDTGRGLSVRVWTFVRHQLLLFGGGQAIFALGFAIGGVYGLGRKAYGAEQHVRSTGEIAGLIVMGLGGLIAVAAGIWFLVLILREMRGWWGRRNEFETSSLSLHHPFK